MDADKRRLVTDERWVDCPYVTVSLTLLSPEEGGRLFVDGMLANTLSTSGRGYLPHLVIDSQSYEKGIHAKGVQSDCPPKDYFGVMFIDGPQKTPPWTALNFTLLLRAYSGIDFTLIQPRVRVALREGSRTVGFGEILSRGEQVGDLLLGADR